MSEAERVVVGPSGHLIAAGTASAATDVDNVDVRALQGRAYVRQSLGRLLLGVAALVFALTVLLFVLWAMLSQVKAEPYDADGVRCYKSALSMTCIKTAEPPR